MVTVGCALALLGLMQEGPSMLWITAKKGDKFEFQQEQKIEFPELKEYATTIMSWGERVVETRPTEVAFSTLYTRDEIVGTGMADILMEDYESLKGFAFICIRNHGNGILRFAKDGIEIKASDVLKATEASWPLTPILPGESWKSTKALSSDGGTVTVTNTFRGIVSRDNVRCYRITSEFAPTANIKQTKAGETFIEIRTGRLWFSTFEYESREPVPEELKDVVEKDYLVTLVSDITRRTNTIYAP